MNADFSRACLKRFLSPRYVNDNRLSGEASRGLARTPGADAWVRIIVSREYASADGVLAATFNAFGPPPVIACADWVCEWVGKKPIDTARCLTCKDIENALELAPSQRYGALVALDALAAALDQLETVQL